MTAATVSHPVFARLWAWMSPKLDAGGAVDHRRRLLAGLAGEVVEVGAGNGLNFGHFTIEHLERLRFPDVRLSLPTSPHVLGIARRA